MQTRLLALVLALTWVLTGSAHSQNPRTPRYKDVMTPANRAVIVEALRKANSSLAVSYAQGAPLTGKTKDEVEAALTVMGTGEAFEVIKQIEATISPRTEVPTGGPGYAKLTFDDGFKLTWAEQRGPQFLFAWYEDDIATVQRALAKLEDEHQRDPDVIDDYLMGRQARILKKMEHPGFFRYGMYWDIDLVDATGKTWRLQPMSLPETILAGFAVSRDRYCRAEDQDTDDLFEAAAHCAYANNAAIELFERSFRNAHHETPGGAVR